MDLLVGCCYLLLYFRLLVNVVKQTISYFYLQLVFFIGKNMQLDFKLFEVSHHLIDGFTFYFMILIIYLLKLATMVCHIHGP